MAKQKFGALICWAVCLTLSTAAVGANRKAQSMVQGMEKDQAALMSKFPALTQIDIEIRSDCAARNKDHLPSGAFCGCASAVAMSLWRSGIDPKMIPLLTEYLNTPTEAGAKEFLAYQGPELYGPLCAEASKR